MVYYRNFTVLLLKFVVFVTFNFQMHSKKVIDTIERWQSYKDAIMMGLCFSAMPSDTILFCD